MVHVTNYKPRPLEATFGYFNSNYATTEGMKRTHRHINIMNALAYIPVIGIIIGIARIIFFSKFISSGNHYSKSEKAFCCLQIVRGCFEILSIGSIFLIPDLIFTINRELEIAIEERQWFYSSFGKFKDDCRL